MVKVLKLNERAILPKRGTAKSAGLDLYPYFAKDDDVFWVEPGETLKWPTGLVVQLPEGHVGLIRPRSSSFIKGLMIEGVLDEDYDKELFLLIHNHCGHPVKVVPGKALAQLLVMPINTSEVVEVDKVKPSETRSGGFGSTDKKLCLVPST